MTLFGLIGYPLSHSFSKKYFTEKFEKEGIKDAFYELFPLQNIHEFPGLILSEGAILKGLNVTIPYKQSVIPYLDELDETAKAVGAVNTISIVAGRLTGFNTDVIGFEKMLENCIDLSKFTGNALVLGTGGASKAVQFILKKRSILFQLVSRNSFQTSISYQDLNARNMVDFPLIINTTPLGMYPNIDTFPEIPYAKLGHSHVLIDLVYNPEETLFMSKGRAQGGQVFNGMQMLKEQAQAAWAIWNC